MGPVEPDHVCRFYYKSELSLTFEAASYHSFNCMSKERMGWREKRGREGFKDMEWRVRRKKRISGSGEAESHRLACSFTNSMLDSLRVQNGCALHRAQGRC